MSSKIKINRYVILNYMIMLLMFHMIVCVIIYRQEISGDLTTDHNTIVVKSKYISNVLYIMHHI